MGSTSAARTAALHATPISTDSGGRRGGRGRRDDEWGSGAHLLQVSLTRGCAPCRALLLRTQSLLY